jgi:hypothetical protein
MKFEFLAAVTNKITVVSDVMPCSLVLVSFRKYLLPPYLTLKMKAVGSYRTFVSTSIYRTTWHHIQSYRNLSQSIGSSLAEKKK